MRVIRALIAKRRKHRYANTRFWRNLNALVTAGFDAFDLFVALAVARFPHFRSDGTSGERALLSFRRIVLRHMADLEVHDKLAFSDNLRKTLLRFASIGVLRRLYPLAENAFRLRYLDFLYLAVGQTRQYTTGHRPVVEIVWSEPRLFEEICALPSSGIVLLLHGGSLQGTRTLSYSRRNLAAVIREPERVLTSYKNSKVHNPEDIEIIPVNRETLLALTNVVKRNKVIICAPDIVLKGQPGLLSLAMFQFAARVKVPLYFFDFSMDEDCTLRGFIKGPIDCGAGVVKAAEDFIGFCQSVSGRTLTIMERRDVGSLD